MHYSSCTTSVAGPADINTGHFWQHMPPAKEYGATGTWALINAKTAEELVD